MEGKAQKIEVAVFGGGCFWCTEAVFQMLRGIISAKPGYSGGTKTNPTYTQVSGGQSGHAEVTRLEYDPQKISYHDLLTVFFATHDPTTLNRQGNDVGTQYRSVIFYTTLGQKKEAEKYISELPYHESIITAVEPFTEFYEAEDYHHNYYESHKNSLYCNLVINPKMEKAKKQFVDLLHPIK